MHCTSNQNGFLPRGFALLELFVVLLVLILLVAIVVPTIGGPTRPHYEARVAAEISSLSAGIARFKMTFGVEPPSRIILSESEPGWTSANRKIIRRLWPQFDFSLPRDLNRDGDTSDHFELNGAECLVYFLGGIQNGGVPIGFSEDPADPFAGGGNRNGPFFEFDPDRLHDTVASNVPGFPEYVDALPRQELPYLYFSSYDGTGYRTSGANSEVPIGTFRAVYCTGKQPESKPHKPQSFQIISAGVDHAYGQGGVFDPKNATTAGLASSADHDNLTNFHPGRLLR